MSLRKFSVNEAESEGPDGEMVTLVREIDPSVGDMLADSEDRPVPQRWYILIIFFLVATIQAASWNFYSPINLTIREIYGWEDATIAWLANTANIAVLVGLPIMSMLIDSLGLRPAVVAATVFTTLCTAFRCLELMPFLNISEDATKILAFVAMCFNGLSGTLMNFVGPIISAAWFPTNQRTASTAILGVAAPVGVSLGYIIGPLAVPYDISLEERIQRLHTMYWVEAGISLAITISIIVYFPSKPPTAPSRSAADKREQKSDVGEGYKKLLFLVPNVRRQAARLWVLAIAYSIPSGVFGGWGAVLYPNLKNYNFSESEAAWLGCVMTLAGCAGGVIVGLLADRFVGKMKTLIIVNYLISGLCFLWFTFFVGEYIDSNKIAIYAVAIAAGTTLVNTIPLFFELTMETIHPNIPEGAAASLLSILGTFVQILFLAFSFTSLADSTGWMNWLMTLSFAICILILTFWKASYPRLSRDKGANVDVAFVDNFGFI